MNSIYKQQSRDDNIIQQLRRTIGIATFTGSIIFSFCTVFSYVPTFSEYNLVFIVDLVGLFALALGVHNSQPRISSSNYTRLISATTALTLLAGWVLANDPYTSELPTLSSHRGLIWLSAPFILYYSTFLKDYEVKFIFASTCIITFLSVGKFLNPNIHSMLLVFAAFPFIGEFRFSVRFSILFAICGYAFYANTTQGVLFGLFTIIFGRALSSRFGLIRCLLPMLCLCLAVLIVRGGSTFFFQDRDLILFDALNKFWANPLYGSGAHEYYARGIPHLHAHNIVATILAERGLVGLGLLFWTLSSVQRCWSEAPIWSREMLLFFLGWSFLDDPIHVLGLHAMIFIGVACTIRSPSHSVNDFS